MIIDTSICLASVNFKQPKVLIINELCLKVWNFFETMEARENYIECIDISCATFEYFTNRIHLSKITKHLGMSIKDNIHLTKQEVF